MQHRISDDMLYHSASGAPILNANAPRPPAVNGKMVAFRQTALHLNVAISAPGRYTLAIVAPNGSVMRSLTGTQPSLRTIPIGNLARGVYLIKFAAKGRTIVRPLSLR
jgi:hypothetical protein